MIDSHFHLHEDIISIQGLMDSMDMHGIQKVCLMPSFCPKLYLHDYVHKIIPFLRSLLLSKNFVLKKAGLFFYNTCIKNGSEINLFGKNYKLDIQPDNNILCKQINLYSDRFYGFIFVNPKGPINPIDEVKKYDSPNIIGVKAHPFWHKYPVSDLIEVAEFCSKNKLIFLIHLGINECGNYKILPELFPELKIIYAHAGTPYYTDVCSFAKTSKNVYVDISCSLYVDENIIKKAISIAGIEKCIFGTDGPYFHVKNNIFDYSFFIDNIKKLNLEQNEYNLLVKENLYKLLP